MTGPWRFTTASRPTRPWLRCARPRAHGVDAQAFCADLADEASCRALVPAVLQQFGRLDAVVNNASLFEYDDVAGFSYALMDRHWRSNVGPALLLAQALHGHLCAVGRSGCVINLLDQKLWNPNPDYLSYTLVEGRAGSRQHAAGAGARTARARVWRGALVSRCPRGR